MDYKYKVGDVLYHKSSGHYGKVRKLAITDNGKKPAYKVINIDDSTYTKWSESRVQLRDHKPPIKPSSSTANVDGPYKKGDYVLLKSLDEARKTDWFTSGDIPEGWGGDDQAKRDMFGKAHLIIGNNDFICRIMVIGIIRTVHKSHIEKIISQTVTDIDETLEKPIDITFDNIDIDDYIVIKTKEQFKSDGISFNDKGNPQVSMAWDSDNTMQEFFGKSIKVTKNSGTSISAEAWSWSLDCIYKIIKKDELVDISSVFDETEEVEEKPKPKPKPITYKPMSVKEEIVAMMPTPILLEGSVGSGKSTILIELAKELDLRYFAMVMSDGSTVSDFKGYKNVVDGTYVATEFRDCFENGGMYVLEELNASTSNMPIIFNSIENDYFVFADKLVKAHPDFRLCATMNTITNAKDFGGRRPLDKSVKNRFHTIIVDTDFKSRFSKDIVWYQKELQKILKSKGSSQTIGSREITRFIKLVDKGMNPILATQKTLDEEGIIMKLDIENLLKRKEDYK